MLDRLKPGDLELLKLIGSLAAQEGVRVYLVGGFVRDLYLGHISPDMDFTVEGDGIAFAQVVATYFHTNCKAFTRFGTAIIQIPGRRKIDFVSARAESYPYAGALPEVVFADIGSDLTRRDYTMNAMALSLQEEEFGMIYALDNSLDDLDRGVIRVIHAGSFKDDPTRVLRGIRFEKRFGYEIEPGTLELMRQSIAEDDLHKISAERVRNEFELAFKEPAPESFFQRAAQLGILDSLFKGLKIPENMGEKIRSYHEAHRNWKFVTQVPHLYQMYFIILFSNCEYPENLKYSRFLKMKWLSILFREVNHYQRHIRGKLRHVNRLGAAWRAIRGLHELTLFVILREETDETVRKLLQSLQTAEKEISPVLTGSDLIEIGIEPGKSVGRILDRIHMAYLDRTVRTREDEWKLARSLWGKYLENAERMKMKSRGKNADISA